MSHAAAAAAGATPGATAALAVSSATGSAGARRTTEKHRPARSRPSVSGPSASGTPAPESSASPQAPRPGRAGTTRVALPGLLTAMAGVALAALVHRLLPAVPMLTAAIVLGVTAAHVPGARGLVRGPARPGLTLAGKRLMRLGVVLLGLKLSLDDVLGIGWASIAMVLTVVAITFAGTMWFGRRIGLPGDQPLLIATGFSICGASAIGAVSEVSGSDEEDVAPSVALVTLCGTLAIAVLPLLRHPLGLDASQFGRWVGASVHDVGQVVAIAQPAGSAALGEAVLVKLMRVALLAPLVAAVAVSVRRRRAEGAVLAAGDGTEDTGGKGGARSGRRTPVVPLFVVGFLAMVALRTTGVLPSSVLDAASHAQELLLAAALVGLGSAVHLPSLVRTGGRIVAVGLGSWVVIAGVSYLGVLLTT